MIKYLFRHNKDYSRFNIIKQFLEDLPCEKDVYILLPFSKNQFLKHFFKRSKIVNDFFISNYDTYVYDRKKISKSNPRSWWKYLQDWVNFRCSYYLLSDTQAHFDYWEKLFGPFKGKHFVLPVFADKTIYYPSEEKSEHEKVRILFYGSFIPLHGIDVILKAFKLMEEQGIAFEAKVIGNGQIYPQMKALYDSLALEHVEMNGEIIKEQALADEIRDYDIVLGVFGASQKARSVVPNKVYQGLACKKTVVTMRSSAIDEFFSPEDLVQCDNTSEELAGTLSELVNDPQKCDRYAEQGYSSFNQLYGLKKDQFRTFVQNVGEE
ncbi:MAG: glycosyltransferase [Sulfurimonadaceae bacterium]|nr:glycosyltransferase [Sulfurimonadaceae bacterium]